MREVINGDESVWEADLNEGDRVIISRQNRTSAVGRRRLGDQPDVYIGVEGVLKSWDALDGSWHIRCDQPELGLTWFHEDCLDLIPWVTDADLNAALASIALSGEGRTIVTPNERILEILRAAVEGDLSWVERDETLAFIKMIESKIDTLRPEGAA